MALNKQQIKIMKRFSDQVEDVAKTLAELQQLQEKCFANSKCKF